jgi:hypothetical protein
MVQSAIVLQRTHSIDGRIVSDQQLAAALTAAQESLQRQPSSGPSLDGGTAADAAGLGMALAPTLPHTSATLAMAEVARLHISTLIKPGEFREPPQDPPPDHLDRTA